MMGPVLVVLFIAITAVSMYGQFKFSIIPNINSWRLARMAMMHAHLLASEFTQSEIGIMKNTEPQKLVSRGYLIYYKLEEVEAPYSLPRDGYGYLDKSPSSGVFEDIGRGTMAFLSDIEYTFSKDVDTSTDEAPRGYAYYTLPVVYGPDYKVGYLHVVITRNNDDESWIKEVWDKLNEKWDKENKVN